MNVVVDTQEDDEGSTEELIENEDTLEDSGDPKLNQRDFASLIISPSDWTVETLHSQIGKQIDLDPAFQRRNVWSTAAKSSFIESLFLGIPIPQILLSSRPNLKSSFLVLDGKQRLLTIKEFIDGKLPNGRDFKLKGLRVLKELEGKTWDAISKDSEWKFRLLNETQRTAIIRGWDNEQVLYEIFYRLNSGSVKLSPMELRMSLHPGDFLKYIIDWTEKIGPLHRLLGKSKPDARMADVELAVRYLSFADHEVQYKGDLKGFLDQICIKYNRSFKAGSDFVERIDAKLARMNTAIVAGRRIFGHTQFCRKYLDGKYESRFNRAVFDIQIGSLCMDGVQEFADRNQEAFVNEFVQLSSDNDFVRSLETTTKSTAATYTRFSKWYSVVERITGISMTIPNIDHEVSN